MADLYTKALDGTTWDDFAKLAKKHNGVWGGCWCMSFHIEGVLGKRTHQGVARIALKGALQEIARLGGGTVESCPEDVEGRSVSGSFLYNATVAMFEHEGFNAYAASARTIGP